ncbi:uncharacterized protein LOC143259458 [Megalopta genalis]|uniref:uncharacterized protein LOC143259458 n=1 Tax=Megalopta genalis TaxID=115081 RepID=UPI003FCF715A
MEAQGETDEFSLQVEARMKTPLVWDSPANCTIQDLKESQYDEVLRLIKYDQIPYFFQHHYFREEPMCKACALLDDQSSVNDYIELVRTWMKDTTSLVACSVKSGRVIGVAVTRIDSLPEKTDVYNRVQILDGSKLNSIMHLMNTVILQTSPYEKLGEPEYFRIYLLCVHPSYRERSVEVALLDACVQAAKSLKILAIGGIFTSGTSQTNARNAGFTLFSEIRYSRWIVDERVVFSEPGRGNYSAAFMGMLVPVEDEKEDPLIIAASSIFGKGVSLKSSSRMTTQLSTSVSSKYLTVESTESEHF